ncbi:MAG: biotin transporter BioY [Deltaproteobacteria bacterium]|nr:biotin transporter BioY [Deltaproteobacteria bacterium]
MNDKRLDFNPVLISTERSRSADFTIAFLQVVGFAALTALCADAKIYLSFSPVPITLQSLAVILSGAILGARKGMLSQMLLIAAGAAGFSVFSQKGAGYLALMGPTGGYILGFVLTAYVVGWMKDHRYFQGFWQTNMLLFISSLFIFIPGVLWLKVLTNISFSHALTIGFYPYLIGDVLKTLVASSFVFGLKKLRG